MKALSIKGWADLWGRRWQSAVILVTVAVAAALLYIGLVSFSAVSSPYDRLMDRTNGPHATFFLPGPDRGAALAERIARQPGVTAAERRDAYETYLVIPGNESTAGVLVTALPQSNPALMGYEVVDGRDLTDAAGEGVLGVSLARPFGIKVGDTVQVSGPDGPRPVKVVGLSADPIFCPYPSCLPQNLFVRPATFAAVAGEAPDRVGLLGVRLANPVEADRFVARAQKDAGRARVNTSFSWLTMRMGNQLMQGVAVMSLMVVALTAIIAAALMTANIIGGAVLGQYREIAVLKALGFTGGQVLLLFTGQNVLLGLVGALLGIGGGQVVARRVLTPVAENMGNPALMRFSPPVALAVLVIIVLVSALFAALAAGRGARLAPAEGLRDGFAAPRAGAPRIVRLLARLGAPAPVVLGVKDVTARPGRTWLTVLSLVVCLVTIGIGTGLGGFIGRISSDLDTLGMPYDMMVSVQGPVPEAVQRQVAATGGVEAVCLRTNVFVTAVDQDQSFRLAILGGDWQSMPWQVEEGRMPQGTGEVALAPGIMKRLGAQVGDRLRLQMNGQEVPMTVVGRYRDPMEMGQVGATTLEAVRTVWPDVQLSGMVVRVRRDTDPATVRAALLAQSDRWMEVTLMRTFLVGGFVSDMLDRTRTLSVLMAVLAALSICTASLLTAREQMREVGIRKAIGMTPAQILATVAAGGAWLGIIGAVLGVPGGAAVNRWVITPFAQSLGYGTLIVSLPWLAAAALVIGGTALSALAAMPAAFWAGRLTTADTLRSE